MLMLLKCLVGKGKAPIKCPQRALEGSYPFVCFALRFALLKKMKEKRSRILDIAAKFSGQCPPQPFPRSAYFCGHSSILLAAWPYQLPPAHGSSVDPFCSWKRIF